MAGATAMAQTCSSLWMKLRSLANLSTRKPNQEQDMDTVIYNIDDLPEAILEHILSFVPMKDAVRTCVLSKKWRYLWISHPILALDQWCFSRREHFTNFVERILLRGCSRIKRFDLNFNVMDNTCLVNSWVSAAVKRNVEDCFVRLNLKDIPGNFLLPYCLFTCATLTRLQLFSSGALKLPSRICLPNLKLLHLVRITFVDEGSTEQLLSSPVLQELTITNCNWDNLKTLTICAPMLKILTILDKGFYYPSLHLYSCPVLVYGNNLKRIHCRSPFLNDYQVEKSCSLVEAHINLPPSHRSRTGQVAHRLHKLLKAMISVKKLTLSTMAVQAGISAYPEKSRSSISPQYQFQMHLVLSSVDVLCSHLPVFPNLKLLDFGCLDLKLQVIIKLLHNAPHLETLILREGIRLYPNDDEHGVILEPAPRCFGSHLRQIRLRHVFLWEKEVRVLKFFLKHAMVLEKLMIHCRSLLPVRRLEENFRKKLLEMHCGSKSLEITFFYP